MQLKALANLSFPKLAWVAEVDRATGIVTLHHGSFVEVRQTFWIEGVWNGSFEAGNFGDTECVFGSGGIVAEDFVRFVPSATTVDFLFYRDDGRQVSVSNSLPLLLAGTQDTLDPRYMAYPVLIDSIMEGINGYHRAIPTKKGHVRRQMYRNLDVSPETIVESDKLMSPQFTCFKDYRSYVQDNYRLIAANARDQARQWSLEIFSTQSTGYDSTAVNAICRPFGIDTVFTVSKGKSKYYLAHNDEGAMTNDDGTEICELVGQRYIRLNRRAFAEAFDHEPLYYCVLHHNQDANLLEISKHISKAGLLLTGIHGEILCSNDRFVRPPLLDTEVRRLELAGHGMSEFRLVVGFIHLPLPFIGARRKPDIVRITESCEMDPWRMGNTYDRPIARRIAEEAGIPRQLFGQSKKASVVIFAEPSVPYGESLRREFFAYLAQEGLLPRWSAWLWPAVRWVNSTLFCKHYRWFGIVYFAERVIGKLSGDKLFRFPRLWSHLDGSLFCFCVNRQARKYTQALRGMKFDWTLMR